jgi:hypothetical protein
MIRAQFSLRTVFVVMTACALLLTWWAPPDNGVECTNIQFPRWRPDLRITTERQFCELLGGKPEQKLGETFDWPDFSKSDVIQVPVNGLAGEPTAEYRVAALGKPLEVDFCNTPLYKVVEALNTRCRPELRYHDDLLVLDSRRVAPETLITFKAKGIALRDALHCMLEPRGLTITILGWDADSVVITTESASRQARVGWDEESRLRLQHRLRFRGKLALITSFVDQIGPCSGAIAYTVPKGAKVLFVTERVANAMDAGYTLLILLTAAALVAYPKWRAVHRRTR